ncbi:MAG: hypothetical protein KGP35_10145, partial [Bacteroidetes bacterium]|nr:hypothetical protein [Bacteroidota bacterium]
MKNKLLGLMAVGLLFFTQTTKSQNIPSYVPKDGLVGWWPFNGNANDESGNGNNGTVNGATLTTDRFGNAGKAYSFDGSDWIELNSLSAINSSNGLAVSTWVKSTGFNTNTNCTVGCGQFYFSRGFDGGNGFYLLAKQGNGPGFQCSVNGPFAGGKGVVDPNVIEIPHTQWYHLLINYDGNKINLYVNGKIAGTTPYSAPIGIDNTSKAAFGRQFVPGYPYFAVGVIDDGAIWNRALSEQEIKNLYTGNICYQNVSVTDTLFINSTITSFNPITYENTIKIYPNPSQGQLT